MNHTIKYNGARGHIPIVKAGDGGLKLISFDLLLLNQGMEYAENTGDSEVCIVILGGRATVQCEGSTWENIGVRRDVFDGPGAGVYVPRDSSFTFKATDGYVEAAVLRTLTNTKCAPAYIAPDMVNIVHRGKTAEPLDELLG